MDKNKILIIEDEAAIRELLCMNLEAVGYDLALVDVMLPGRDGFDLIGGLNKKRDSLHISYR